MIYITYLPFISIFMINNIYLNQYVTNIEKQMCNYEFKKKYIDKMESLGYTIHMRKSSNWKKHYVKTVLLELKHKDRLRLTYHNILSHTDNRIKNKQYLYTFPIELCNYNLTKDRKSVV